MSYQNARTQIEQLFLDNFQAQYPDVLIAFENFSVKADERTWVRMSIQNFANNRMDLGCNLFRTVGQIVVQIFNTANTGESESDEMADFIAKTFREADILNIQFFGTNKVPVGKDGNWYQSLVLTDYEADAYYPES